MDSPIGDPLVGTTVAQYEVLAKLGGGGMGVVYAARDTRLGRRVALKFLPPQWNHDAGARQRFTREAQAASATDHPNICTIHDIATAPDGRLFIVMAHYDGPTLKEKLESGPLPVDQAVEIAAQAAEGLHKAHAQAVVHRDIKPGNLILSEDGVRILDFGLARFAGALHLTLEGSTLGTVAYMSPEQTRGDDADARSDVWSLGVVLYEMLSGELPFKGAYAEAISHAIKHDAVPALRVTHGQVEALERIVRRALDKDPAQRYQSARELARDLRLLQGRTVPLDLRTEQLPPLPARRQPLRRRWWTRPATFGTAAVVLLIVIGAPLWLLSPAERLPVVVAPVVNRTGYAELDAYRLALTAELIGELAQSPGIRVLPYDRLLQSVRRFRADGQDVSSRDAIHALTASSDARVVIVPTLLYESGAWRARVEFRNPATATNEAELDTAAVVSSLSAATVYELMPALVDRIDEHFLATGSHRAAVASRVRALLGRSGPSPTRRFRTIEAAAAFAEGLDAYDELEYAASLRAFVTAAQHDPLQPLVPAWQSRVARILRLDDQETKAADQAIRLLDTQALPEGDRLFVEAVAAESRRDFPTAEARYRSLVALRPDEPAGPLELAAYFDRRNQTADAVRTYQAALTMDRRLLRPELELCRLYGPTRLNESATATQHGQSALAKARALGARGGEAQALLCLTDVLRVGGAAERAAAGEDARAALAILETLDYPYNVARAHHYVALVAKADGNLSEAVASWERALAGTREGGNTTLQSSILINLGVTYEALGNRGRALDLYRQAAVLSAALGNERGAVYSRADAGAILVEYSTTPEAGVRDLENALAVVRKLGDKNFEVFCLQMLARRKIYAGAFGDAERQLTQALALARERNLTDKVTALTIDLARIRLETGDATRARDLLREAVKGASGQTLTYARIRLAQALARLDDRDAAAAELTRALPDIERRGDTGLLPLWHATMGERAYTTGSLRDARAHFAQAASYWTDDFPDPASVEARAYTGVLQALGGARDTGRANVRASLDQAVKMGNRSLASLCRTLLAQADGATRPSAVE